MSARPTAIDVIEVRKKYRGGVEALKGLSLQVPRGEIFGLLGPNGAGKSTLLKILLTIIKPSHCRGVMLGHPIGDKQTLAKVGYLPEHVRFPDYLTGRQVIRYSAGLSGICQKFCKKREEELLGFVGMMEWADKKMKSYSKGMKQRIGLAQALVNDPELIFLDEPTDGVDPQGRKEMRGVLQTLRDQGRTVFVNSHLLGELEMVCDSVAILNHGELVKQGRLAELTSEVASYQVSYHGHLGAELRARLSELGEVHVSEPLLEVATDNSEIIQPIIDLLRSHQVVIDEVKKSKQSLEDLFLSIVDGAQQGGRK
ncbi:ABC transporter ATP-binding protein [Rubritalea spongiae]|uniref:ABC transporter ATP-binding protein n=1 Tax=Rubritalea spongiae TaxID=430797 RepID=A0ABW5E3K2_9BACT